MGWLWAWIQMRQERRYAISRQMDLVVLWPDLRDRAVHIEQAKVAFQVHTDVDPAWAGIPEDEIYRIIENLT